MSVMCVSNCKGVKNYSWKLIDQNNKVRNLPPKGRWLVINSEYIPPLFSVSMVYTIKAKVPSIVKTNLLQK